MSERTIEGGPARPVYVVNPSSATDVQPVSVAELPLPDGAATQQTLAELLARLNQAISVTQSPTASLNSGAITAAGQSVAVTVGDAHASWSVQVTGTVTAGILRTEASLDGTTYIPIAFRSSNGGELTNSIIRTGLYRGSVAGLRFFRVRAETGFAGSVTVTVNTAQGVGAVFPNTFQVNQSIEQYYASTSGRNVLFDATTGEVVAANNGGPVALLRNPAGSGVDMYIAMINYGTNGNGVFRRYRNPTITNVGTAITPGNRGGGGNAAAGQFYTLPNLAASNPGALRRTSYVGAYSESRNQLAGNLILRPGQDFYVTYNPAAIQSNSATVEFIWWEAASLV